MEGIPESRMREKLHVRFREGVHSELRDDFKEVAMSPTRHKNLLLMIIAMTFSGCATK